MASNNRVNFLDRGVISSISTLCLDFLERKSKRKGGREGGRGGEGRENE